MEQIPHKCEKHGAGQNTGQNCLNVYFKYNLNGTVGFA